MDQWLELTDGSFKGFAFHVAVPTVGLDAQGATEVHTAHARRLQVIRRPFQNGARVRDMGGEPRTFSASLVFFGPGYLDQLEQFKALLIGGTSGTLILPDVREGVNVAFQSMDESSSAAEGNCKRLRVTWVEDEVSDLVVAAGAAQGLIPTGVLQGANSVTQAVGKAQQAVRNNPVLATIRQVESVISQATSSVVTTAALAAAVKSRIRTTAANLEGALTTSLEAVTSIVALFGGAPAGSGFTPADDEETGNQTADFNESASTAAKDPLARPADEPDTTVELQSLETQDGLDQFLDDTVALLTASADSLMADTRGRTPEVSDAVTEMVNQLRDLVSAVSLQSRKLVLTPSEMSLAEVLFQNSVSLDEVMDVYRRNTFLTDILVVPRGTVIEL